MKWRIMVSYIDTEGVAQTYYSDQLIRATDSLMALKKFLDKYSQHWKDTFVAQLNWGRLESIKAIPVYTG